MDRKLKRREFIKLSSVAVLGYGGCCLRPQGRRARRATDNRPCRC